MIISINMVTILMMPTKLATPGLLKIISVHGVTNEVLLPDSHYIVDLLM